MSIFQYVYSRGYTISNIDGEFQQDRSAQGFGPIGGSKMSGALFSVLNSSELITSQCLSASRVVSRYVYNDYGMGSDFAVVGQMVNLPNGNYLNGRRSAISHLYVMSRDSIKSFIKSDNALKVLDFVFKEKYVKSGVSEGDVISTEDWRLPIYASFNEIPCRGIAETPVQLNKAHIEQILHGFLVQHRKVAVCAHEDETKVDGIAGYVIERIYKTLPAAILTGISFNTNCIAELPDCCNLVFCNKERLEKFKESGSFFCVDMTKPAVEYNLVGKNSWDVTFIKSAAEAICNAESHLIPSMLETKNFEREYESASSSSCAYSKATCFSYINLASRGALEWNNEEQQVKGLTAAYGYAEIINESLKKDGIMLPSMKTAVDRLFGEIEGKNQYEIFWKNMHKQEFDSLFALCSNETQIKTKKILEQAYSLSQIRNMMIVQRGRVINSADTLIWLRCAKSRYEEEKIKGTAVLSGYEGYKPEEIYMGYEIALNGAERFPKDKDIEKAAGNLLNAVYDAVGQADINKSRTDVMRVFNKGIQDLYNAMLASRLDGSNLSCAYCLEALNGSALAGDNVPQFKNIENLRLYNTSHDSAIVRDMYLGLMELHRFDLLERYFNVVRNQTTLDTLVEDMTKKIIDLLSANELSAAIARTIFNSATYYGKASAQDICDDLLIAVTVLACTQYSELLYEFRNIIKSAYRNMERTVGTATVEQIITWTIEMNHEMLARLNLTDVMTIEFLRIMQVDESVRRRKSNFASSYEYLISCVQGKVNDQSVFDQMKQYCTKHGCEPYPKYKTIEVTGNGFKVKGGSFLDFSVDVKEAISGKDDRKDITGILLDSFFELATDRVLSSGGRKKLIQATPFISLNGTYDQQSYYSVLSELVRMDRSDPLFLLVCEKLTEFRDDLTEQIWDKKSRCSYENRFAAASLYNESIAMNPGFNKFEIPIRTEEYKSYFGRAKNWLSLIKTAEKIRTKNAGLLSHPESELGLHASMETVDSYLSKKELPINLCLKQLTFLVKKNKKVLINTFDWFPETVNTSFRRVIACLYYSENNGQKIPLRTKKKIKKLKKKLNQRYKSVLSSRKTVPAVDEPRLFKVTSEELRNAALETESAMCYILNADLKKRKESKTKQQEF